ncbi:MAG: VOC family protein [Acidobacteriota bacterium]
MVKAKNAIPEGFHTVTPYLVVKDAGRAIDFYREAFGAEEELRMPGPDGNSVMHAEIRIGDSHLFLADECPERGCKSPLTLGGSPSSIHLYVTDVDAAFKKAIDAGAEAVMPVADMFWGDRYGKVKDPFGHEWGIATHKEELTPEEIGERARRFFTEMSKQ